jgi:hypothetical protein
MVSAALASQDEAPGSLFQHDSLDSDVRAFHLLRILPTLVSGLVQFELTTADFASNVAGFYNALSYEWGLNEPPFYWVRVNEGHLRIRKNLHSFLQLHKQDCCWRSRIPLLAFGSTQSV